MLTIVAIASALIITGATAKEGLATRRGNGLRL